MKDRTNEIINNFLGGLGHNIADGLSVKGTWKKVVTRADGTVEEQVINNIVTANGLNAIASRVIAETTSPFTFLAIGTGTNATTPSMPGSLGSAVTQFGEVDRKAASTSATSKDTVILVATWGGASDSLTGVALVSGGAVNHVNSGLGTLMNLVNSVDTTLAASDTLQLQCEIQIGSHDL